MKKVGLLLGVVLTSVIAGCSATKSPNKTPLFAAGEKCSVQLLEASKGRIGTTNFTSVFLDDASVVKAGDATHELHHIQGIPYVESSALDNGKPGSAWHNCMQQAGFTI